MASELPGVLATLADHLGEDQAEAVGRVLAGTTVKFPSLSTLERIHRDRAIRYEYRHGVPVSQIAARYGVSEPSVYRIAKKKN